MNIAATQEEEGPQFLHKNLVITSDRQRSSQGTVFYFKFNSVDLCGEQDKSVECILKIYPQNEQETYDKEEKILRQIQAKQFSGFPKILSSIKGVTSSEMILEALGPNLRHLLEASPKRHFSKATTLLITIQLIERIRDIHLLGWMHNDIKLENILIGYKDPAKIYLIDFGLSQPFVDFQTGYHVQKTNLSYFSGNFMFASLNSCRGNNKSRRDDIESIFYLMIYLYNNNFLPWRDFKGTFKQMIVQRLQLRVTKSLFKMIPPCLEECLKYVLLLNFDEEPKYNYLIEQLKNAYYNEIAASGEKINPNAIKQPVFEWNVSLATRLTKAITELDGQWMQGERALSMNNLDVLSTSLMKSKLFLNFNASNYDSSNNGSANMNLDQVSSHSKEENQQMLEQMAKLSQGSDNMDSNNLGIRRPLFQRNVSFNNHNSATRFSKFKPFKDQNRSSHSPLQTRHLLIEKGLMRQNRGSNKNNSSDTFSDEGPFRHRGGVPQVLARKSSFYEQAQNQQLQVRNKYSGFALNKNKQLGSVQADDQTSNKAEGDAPNSKSEDSLNDSEEDSDYVTPRNDVNDLRKQFRNNILIQELESSQHLAGQSTNDKTQSSFGQGNIPSQEIDEKMNQCYQVSPQQYHQQIQQQQQQQYQQQIYQEQQLQQQLLQQQQLQQQQQMLLNNPHLLLQNQQNYQLLLQQQQQQLYKQQFLQQQLLQQQQLQQQLQQQQHMIHPLIQQLPTPNFAAAHLPPQQLIQQVQQQPELQQLPNLSTNVIANPPYFRVMKVHQNDLKVRGSGGPNSPLNVKQPANNPDDDTMMID